MDTTGDRGLVSAAGDDELALLADDDRGARVLARRQHTARGDRRVLQQLHRDEPVVGRRLGVIEDRPELRQVPGPQEVGDVAHRLGGEQGEHAGIHLEELASTSPDRRDTIGRQEAVRRVVVVPRREHVLVDEVVAHRVERYRRRVRV